MNRLRLNPAKTQVIWLGSKQLVDKVDIIDVPVMSTTVRTADSVRNLGVILDSYLMMALHVSAVCRPAYYQLRQLRTLMRSLSFDAAKLLVQAFISTRLDYCNSLMYGISDNLSHRPNLPNSSENWTLALPLGVHSVSGGALTTFACKFGLKIFFLCPREARATSAPPFQ